MSPLPAIMFNSDLTVPQTCIYDAAVFVFCEGLRTTMCYVTEKVTPIVGCSPCLPAVRAPYLVLSLFLVLIRDPSLPIVTVRHFVWAHKLDTAKVFGSLGDDARHLGWHKQVHLKEARKKKAVFHDWADLKFQLWKHEWGEKIHVCCIYLIIPHQIIYVKWIIHLYIRQFLIKLKRATFYPSIRQNHPAAGMKITPKKGKWRTIYFCSTWSHIIISSTIQRKKMKPQDVIYGRRNLIRSVKEKACLSRAGVWRKNGFIHGIIFAAFTPLDSNPANGTKILAFTIYLSSPKAQEKNKK